MIGPTERRRRPEARQEVGEKLHETLEAVDQAKSVLGFLVSKRAVVTLFLAALTYIGIQVVWPKQRFEALEQGQAAILKQVNERVDAVERRQNALEEVVRLSVYVQCVQLRRSDPAAVPAECNAAILQGRP